MKIFGVFLIPIGLFFYMYYLKSTTGDPLEFLHSVGIYGEQRSTQIILLPQVFYRYIFKILPNINYDYFPVVFTTWLEFLTAVLFGGLGLLGILGGLKRLRKIRIRLSYLIFLVLGYIIPTLSGSFSSMPRYVLILFPGFILMAVYLNELKSSYRYFFFCVLFILLGIATALFVRGYWIA